VDAREGRFEPQGIVVDKGRGKGRSISLVGLCAVLARLRSFDLAVIVIGNNMRKKNQFPFTRILSFTLRNILQAQGKYSFIICRGTFESLEVYGHDINRYCL
jgi:hypothetical protein